MGVVVNTVKTVERGATIGSTSASVTTTSGQIVAASATRRTIVLTNLGSDYVWVGASGVTDNQGIRLAPGQALTIDKSPRLRSTRRRRAVRRRSPSLLRATDGSDRRTVRSGG